MQQYWVVGAAFGGKDDALTTFKRRGYWYCWDANKHHAVDAATQPSVARQQERLKMISVGDRIAVKRLLGQGSKEIAILALGIVTDVDTDEWRVYVNWVVDPVDRRVPIHGCAASIHGPFSGDDPWVQQVFQL